MVDLLRCMLDSERRHRGCAATDAARTRSGSTHTSIGPGSDCRGRWTSSGRIFERHSVRNLFVGQRSTSLLRFISRLPALVVRSSVIDVILYLSPPWMTRQIVAGFGPWPTAPRGGRNGHCCATAPFRAECERCGDDGRKHRSAGGLSSPHKKRSAGSASGQRLFTTPPVRAAPVTGIHRSPRRAWACRSSSTDSADHPPAFGRNSCFRSNRQWGMGRPYGARHCAVPE